MKQQKYQRQPSIGGLIKRGSEIWQYIYTRAPMSKCLFNKIANHLH